MVRALEAFSAGSILRQVSCFLFTVMILSFRGAFEKRSVLTTKIMPELSVEQRDGRLLLGEASAYQRATISLLSLRFLRGRLHAVAVVPSTCKASGLIDCG